MRDEAGRLLHAETMTPALFFRFVFTQRVALWSFLHWAAQLPSVARASRVKDA